MVYSAYGDLGCFFLLFYPYYGKTNITWMIFGALSSGNLHI